MFLLSANFLGSMFVYLLTTVGIIIAAYYTTIWIGKKSRSIAKGRHISLLEKVLLPGGITISVVKIGQYVYVLANNGKTVEQLDRLTYEEWKDSNQQHSLEPNDDHVRHSRMNPFFILNDLRKLRIDRKENVQKGDGN